MRRIRSCNNRRRRADLREREDADLDASIDYVNASVMVRLWYGPNHSRSRALETRVVDGPPVPIWDGRFPVYKELEL